MMVKILYFAAARERAGRESEERTIGADTTVVALLDGLCAAYAGLATIRSALRIAVNHEFVGDDVVLRAGDEIALIPPVSGG